MDAPLAGVAAGGCDDASGRGGAQVRFEVEGDDPGKGLACFEVETPPRRSTRLQIEDAMGFPLMSVGSSGQSMVEPHKRRRVFLGVVMTWIQWLPMQVVVLMALSVPQLIIFFGPRAPRRSGCTRPWIREFGCWMPQRWPASQPILLSSMTGMAVYLLLCALAAGCRLQDSVPMLLYVVWYTLFLTSPEYQIVGDRHSELLQPNGIFDLGAAINLILLILYVGRLGTLMLWMWSLPRHLVSKRKNRLVDTRHGFDLDLSYITANIIAMGWPAESVLESQLRNPMSEVQRFLRTRHRGNYKVYNLCLERSYASESFEDVYNEVRFPDHNPCLLTQLQVICSDMQAYLKGRAHNVVAVHCKAGKGRTGLVIAAFLLHTRQCKTADEALKRFGSKRTRDGKGVTIPSQIRYVHYYERVVKEGGNFREPRWLQLLRVDVDGWDATEGWHIQIITHEDGVVFSSAGNGELSLQMRRISTRPDIAMRPVAPPLLEGDVKIVVFLEKEKQFHFWLHTAYDPPFSPEVPVLGRTVWRAPSSPTDVPWRPLLPMRLGRSDLDGLRKRSKSKVQSPARPNLEVQAVFAVPLNENEVLAQKAERERRRTKRDLDRTQQVMRRKNHAEPEDYDDLHNETDLEILLTSLQTGYLTRWRHRCAAGEKRWCALHTSGCLNLAGDPDVFVVNLAAPNADAVFMEAEPSQADRAAWRVRHPVTGRWETIEACGQEAKFWRRALADAMQLGAAARDSATDFVGFFWKLRSEAPEVAHQASRRACYDDSLSVVVGGADGDDDDDDVLRREFEFSEWRMRLFVLRKDGGLCYHSWKDGRDVEFCSLRHGQGASIRRLKSEWRSMEYLVPFLVQAPDGNVLLLAGATKDVDALLARAGVLSLHDSVDMEAPAAYI